jgi:chromosome segregation ATPase
LSKISVSQAAKLSGKSRETINKATQNGTLAYTLNSATKRKEIDVAELERVYKLVTTMAALEEASVPVKSASSVSSSDTSVEAAQLRVKLASSERTIEMIQAERDRERRQLESEIENLRSSLEKAQEQHGKALLLITDQSSQTQSKKDDWDKSLRALEARLANHEKEQRETKEAAKRKIASLQRALEQERTKSFFERLFGGGQGARE